MMQTQPTQPEALRFADLIHCGDDKCQCSFNLAAAELRRLHAYAQNLESQVIVDCMMQGTPVAGGEPIGYLLCGCASGDELPDWEINQLNLQFDKLNEHYAALGEEATLPLYTSPQPVVREPLTREQALEIVNKKTDVMMAIRLTEAAHGITGGQHGTD